MILKKLNITRHLRKRHLSGKKAFAGIGVMALLLVVAAVTGIGFGIPKADAENDNGIVIETVSPTTTQTAEETSKQLDSIADYLSSLEDNVNNNIEILNELKETSVTASTSEKNTDTITSQVKTINTEMTTLSTEIVSTQTLINDLQKELVKDITDQGTASATGISQVAEKMEEIKGSYEASHEKITNLIKEAEKTGTSENQELVKQLNLVEKNMSESDEANFATMENNLLQLSKELSDSLSENSSSLSQQMTNEFTQNTSSLSQQMTNGFAENATSLSEQINNGFSETNGYLSLQITNGFSQLNNNVTNQYGAMSESLSDQLDRIDEDIKQAFTSVNNGKKMLASTLFTVHGITISEDATFAEFNEAITKIEKNYYLGVKEIPGEISYEYHYHKDGKGAHCTGNMVPASQKGGCYTIPYYHKHSGHSGSKGGCYTKPHVHKHSNSCYVYGDNYDVQYLRNAGWKDGDYQAKIWRCRDCGAIIEGTEKFEPAHHIGCPAKKSLRCSIPEGHIEYYELGCGKNKNTLEGYVTSCGLSDNQIIAAHIVYNPEATAVGVKTSLLETSHIVNSFNFDDSMLMNSFIEDLGEDESLEVTLPDQNNEESNSGNFTVISEEEYAQEYGDNSQESEESEKQSANPQPDIYSSNDEPDPSIEEGEEQETPPNESVEDASDINLNANEQKPTEENAVTESVPEEN